MYSTPAIRKSMSKSKNSTKVKALDTQPFKRTDIVANTTNDEPTLNPNGGKSFDCRKPQNGLSKPRRNYKVASFNCRTLQNDTSRVKLNKLLRDKTINVACIQEHRYVHKETDPDIVARDLGWSLFLLLLLLEILPASERNTSLSPFIAMPMRC